MFRHSPVLLAILLLPGCAQRSARPASAAAMRDALLPAAPASTFCNPLDLDYRFALDTPSRRDVADPVMARVDDDYYLFAANTSGYWHSRNLRDWRLIVPTGLPMDDGAPRVLVLAQIYYSSRGMKGVYTSDDPSTGVWRAATADELTRVMRAGDLWMEAQEARGDGGGFASRTVTVSSFDDREAKPWRVASIEFAAGGRSERRLAIFPTIRSGWGGERTDLYLGDYPQLIPGSAMAGDHNAAGWMLLSSGKKATSSSSVADHPTDLAFDENAATWWSAASGGVGEWLTVDLGAMMRVAALQINFAEQGTHALGRDDDSYQQYLVESSIDGVHWTTRIDESGTTRDRPHRYVQLDSARNARFVRIVNVHAAAGGNFAIRDLRIFGRSPLAAPAAAEGVSVQRAGEGGSAAIAWKRATRATGYVVRFGAAENELSSSQRVGDVATVTIDGLSPAVPYWFAVDAIGEGGITRGAIAVPARPGT